jgi:5-methylcytosine-specific restriction enzyme A
MPARIPTHRPRGLPDQAKLYEQQPRRREDGAWYRRLPWYGPGGVREAKLKLNPTCEDCLQRGRVVVATEVHHVIPRKERPDLALDLANLRSLCKPCHNAKRAKR